MVKKFVSSVCMVCLLCAIHSHCAAHPGAADLAPKRADPTRGNDWLYAERLGRGLEPPSRVRTARSKAAVSDDRLRPHDGSESHGERDAVVDSFDGGRVSDVEERLRLPRHAGPDVRFDNEVFVRQVFEKYGDGHTMEFEGFERMLKTLRLDDGKRKDDAAVEEISNNSRSYKQMNSSSENVTNASVTPQSCLKPRDLFAAFSLPAVPRRDETPSANRIGHVPADATSSLDASGFARMCPSLIYSMTTRGEREGDCMLAPVTAELEAHTHGGGGGGGGSKVENRMHVWLYATLSVVLISLCGLAGVAVIPFMQHKYYHRSLQFFVALAIGTLCGDALLHLLPHAMSSYGPLGMDHTNHDSNMWKGLVASLGIVLLTFAEKFLSLGSEWRTERQSKKKQVPSRVRVMRDMDGLATVGEKLCKHKYSSYPYCYDEINTEVTGEKHHKAVQHNGQASDEHNHNEEVDMKPATTTGGGGDGHKVAMDNGDANGKEAALIGGVEDEEAAAGKDYTVYLREHETSHHGHSHTHGHVFSSHENMSAVAWMVIMGDGLHNFTDGMAIGAAFSANIAGGFSTAVAVFCHELPHELGDFAVLLKTGMSAKQAVFYNMISSVLCLAGMVLGIWLGAWDSATEWIFAGAAGTFIYIALVDMIPELTSTHSKDGRNWVPLFVQVIGMLTGLAIMFAIAFHEDDLKHLFTDHD